MANKCTLWRYNRSLQRTFCNSIRVAMVVAMDPTKRKEHLPVTAVQILQLPLVTNT